MSEYMPDSMLELYLLERNQRQDGVVNYFYDKYGKADGDGKENI